MSSDEFEGEKYQTTYGDRERVGPQQKTGMEFVGNILNQGLGITNIYRGAHKLGLTDEDIFKFVAAYYYDKFGGDREYTIRWDTIVNKIPYLSHMKYRNPILFVLSAKVLVRNGNKYEISLDQLRKTSIYKSILETSAISTEDIVRYARHWILHLL